MSDSVRPHRRQPTRLPHPWDSPGKNTGVGCHFLLQCMKVKSESEVAQSCLTLRGPMDHSLPVSSVHGIFQARVLEWGATALSHEQRRIYQFFQLCPSQEVIAFLIAQLGFTGHYSYLIRGHRQEKVGGAARRVSGTLRGSLCLFSPYWVEGS